MKIARTAVAAAAFVALVAGANDHLASAAEEYAPDQALALLRLGVADYLGGPLDLSQLSSLIEVLTARGRRAGAGPAVAARPAVGAEAERRAGRPAVARIEDHRG